MTGPNRQSVRRALILGIPAAFAISSFYVWTSYERRTTGARVTEYAPPTTLESVTGQGFIAGTITDSKGVALRRADVVLTAVDTQSVQITSSDDSGNYEFPHLISTRYELAARKSGYIALKYGQRGVLEPSQVVDLSIQQRSLGLNIALPRSSVVSVRVTDEYGEPFVGSEVSVLYRERHRGEEVWQTPPAGRGRGVVNDEGDVRIFDLLPGEYVVAVRYPLVNQDVGYTTTYAPGTKDITEARRIRLLPEAETVIPVILRRSRLLSVSGWVLDSQGNRASEGSVRLMYRTSVAVPRITSPAAVVRIKEDGSFSIGGIPPGEYTMIAAVAPPPRPGLVLQRLEVDYLPIRLSESVDNIVLTSRAGASVSGHITTESDCGETNPSIAQIITEPIDSNGRNAGGRIGILRPDNTFEINGLFGRQVVYAQLPHASKMYVKSVDRRGEDISARGLLADAQSKVSDIEVRLGCLTTQVVGEARWDDGTHGANAVIVAFAKEESMWTHPFDRYVVSTRATAAGRFTIAGLPTGSYWLAAVERLDGASSLEPMLLRELRDMAGEVRIADGNVSRVTLQVSSSGDLQKLRFWAEPPRR